MKEFSKGDAVSWNTPQGKTSGKVTKKVISPTHVSGHKVQASGDNPQYEVRSGSSGKKAVHKPESLDKS